MLHFDQDLDMRHEIMRTDTGIMLKEKNTLDKSIYNSCSANRFIYTSF